MQDFTTYIARIKLLADSYVVVFTNNLVVLEDPSHNGNGRVKSYGFLQLKKQQEIRLHTVTKLTEALVLAVSDELRCQ